MGWTILYRYNSPKNYAEEKQLIIDLFRPAEKFDVLQASKVGSVWYVAARLKLEENSPVIACVIQTSRKNGEFGYKDMDETMHPYFYGAPLSLLNKLTPTDNARANDWRNECRKRHAEKEKISKSDILKIGMKVDTTGMFGKYDGMEINTLVVKDIENRRFYWPDGDRTFQLMHKQVREIKARLLEKQEQTQA